MPKFQIQQRKNAKGKTVSGDAIPVDTGERILTPSERATAANLTRQLSHYQRGDFSPEYRLLFENMARIPLPTSWPHRSLHPAVYITRFPEGPSRHLAEDCCQAMLAWWERHGEARMAGKEVPEVTLDFDAKVPPDPRESIVEFVDTPESAATVESLLDELESEAMLEAKGNLEAHEDESEEASEAEPAWAQEGQVDPADLLEEEEAADDDVVDEDGDEAPPPDPLADDPELGVHTQAEDVHEEPPPVHEEAESAHTETKGPPEETTAPQAETKAPARETKKASSETAADDRHPCPAKGCVMVCASSRGLTQHIKAKHPAQAAKLLKARKG